MKPLRPLVAVAGALACSSLALAQPGSYTDLGTHTSVETFSQSVTLTAANDIQWFKIVLPAAANVTASYIDIWVNTPGDITDSEIGLYSNTGALEDFDDDDGPGNLSQLSYGQTAPPRPANGGGLTFTGQDGALAAGTWWVAVGHYNVTFNATAWNVTSSYTSTQRTITLNFRIQPAGAPTNPSGVGTATPASGGIGTTFVAAVTVTPGTNPASTGLGVSLNAANVDGGTVTLLDDGNSPDAIAGDNIFSGNVTVGPAATPGTKSLAFTITDAQARTGTGNLTFGVIPPNDLCANAALVSEGTYAWDNSAATTDGSASCQTSSNKDIWFEYLPTFTGTQTVSLCGTTFDTVLSVYSACGGTQLACDDDACDGVTPPGSGFASIVTNLSVTSGTPVRIRVASFGSAPTGGAGTLTINLPPTNPNGIGTATPNKGGIGTTFVAAVTASGGNNPPSTGLGVTLDTTNVDGGGVITLLDDGNPPDAILGDNIFSGNVTVGPSATLGVKSLQFTVTDAQSRSGTGNIGFTVTPPNDDCANPTPVVNGIYSWDNSGATTDGASPSCQSSTSKDLWYLYSPSLTGTANITTCGTVQDTVLSVYDTCGGTQLACDDDTCNPGLQSQITGLAVNSSSTYLIRVASYGTSATGGPGTLTIEEPNSPPSGTGTATPTSGGIGVSFVAKVTVTSGHNPQSTGLGVSLDASLVDGGPVTLLDDGNPPDDSAGDNIFSGTVTVGPSATPGSKSLPFTVSDAELRSSNGTIGFTVLAPPPANDNCGNPEPVIEGTYSFDNSGATTDGASPSCQATTNKDMWYEYIASHNGTVEITLCGTTFDTVVSVTDACGGAELECDDDSCDGVTPPGSTLASIITGMPVTYSTHYIVRVAAYGSSPLGGAGTMTITLTPAPCPGDTNGDYAIDLGDLATLLAAYGTSTGDPGYNPLCDLNSDGSIDLIDLAQLLSKYGTHC